MPQYDFNTPNSVERVIQTMTPQDGNGHPQTSQLAYSNIVPRTKDVLTYDKMNVYTNEQITEFLINGYRTMDRGIKNYFSGMFVPTADGVKPVQVRISGGDKAYLIWEQDLRRGRVQLPVISIKRSTEENNPSRFSPAFAGPVSKRFADAMGESVILTYRPVPSKINYTISVFR